MSIRPLACKLFHSRVPWFVEASTLRLATMSRSSLETMLAMRGMWNRQAAIRACCDPPPSDLYNNGRTRNEGMRGPCVIGGHRRAYGVGGQLIVFVPPIMALCQESSCFSTSCLSLHLNLHTFVYFRHRLKSWIGCDYGQLCGLMPLLSYGIQDASVDLWGCFGHVWGRPMAKSNSCFFQS